MTVQELQQEHQQQLEATAAQHTQRVEELQDGLKQQDEYVQELQEEVVRTEAFVQELQVGGGMNKRE